MNKAVPYYRVSTEKQGQSGLGLEAQQKAVREYAQRYNLELMKEHTEVETGKQNKRPVLKKALKLCEQQKATLLIAKLDRLGRNALFIGTLMESKVEFVAVDNPEANTFILHIMAAFAQYEGEQISQRTKLALAAAKSRGVKLGKYGKYVLSEVNKQNAIEFARRMMPIVDSLKQEGFITVRALSDVMNKRKIKPYSGGKAKWHPCSTHTLLKRIEQLQIQSTKT